MLIRWTGGETIKDMQNTSGAKINVAGPSGADIMRDITLVGPPGAIEAAKRAITDKVDAVVSQAIITVTLAWEVC